MSNSPSVSSSLSQSQSHPPPYLHKLEFTSHGGSYIKIGHYKNKANNSEQFRDNFLAHTGSVDNFNKPKADSGLSQTRFHKGFQRKQQADIRNPIAEQGQEFSRLYAEKSAKLAESRSQILNSIDKATGYNIITGQDVGKGPINKPYGRKSIANGLGPESRKAGEIALRNNETRFFTPHSSGQMHENRQGLLYREGLEQKKFSSVLGIGRKEMPSYGVEDQFSKSQYTNNSAQAQYGLVEKRSPGKFTPRKVPNHPSGKEAVLREWTSTIDLRGDALRKQ